MLLLSLLLVMIRSVSHTIPFCKHPPQCGSVWQSLAVANKAVFWNCLAIMRPKTLIADLPTTHNVKVHLHNKIVVWIRQLRSNIEVC
jgi:hypothetical protein